MRLKAITAVVIAAGISGFALTACGGSDNGSTATSSGASTSAAASTGAATTAPAATGLLADLQKSGSVKAGVISNPPFSDVTSDGSFSGIAPDLASAIFSELGVPKIDAVTATYANVIPGLQAKHWDVVASALDITPERCKEVIFSEPISVVPMVALVKKGTAAGITSVKQLVEKHEKFAELEGGTGIDTVKAAGMSDGDIQSYPNNAARAAAMNAGRADFTIASYTSIEPDLKTLGDGWEATGPLSDAPIEVSAFAFRKDDTDLRDQVNAQLKTMQDNGEYATIAKKWGFPTDTENKTMEEACNAGA